MTTVDDVLSYMNGCQGFIDSQASLLPEDVRKDSVRAMGLSLRTQIGNIPKLTPASATALNTAIAASAFTPEVKTDMGQAVLEKLTWASPVSAAEDNKGQVMMYPQNFMAATDWTYIEDLAKTNSQVALRIRHRLGLLGLPKPSQQTYGKLASLAAAARQPDMDSVGLHNWVKELKQVQLPKLPEPSVSLKLFPTSASDLPKELYDRGYASAGAPEPRVLPEFDALFARCPLRSTHKSLRSAPVGGGIVLRGQPQLTQGLVEQAMVNFASQFLTAGTRFGFQQAPDGSPQRPDIQELQASPGDGQIVLRDQRFGAPLTPDARHAPAGLVDEIGLAEDKRPVADVPLVGAEAADLVLHLEKVAAVEGDDGPGKDAAKKRPASAMKSMKFASIVLKRPVSAKKPAVVASKVLKRPASAKKRLILGCSRCRGSRIGCLQCRNPNYGGRRFQK